METVDCTPLHKSLHPSNTAPSAQMNIKFTSSKYSTAVEFFPYDFFFFIKVINEVSEMIQQVKAAATKTNSSIPGAYLVEEESWFPNGILWPP